MKSKVDANFHAEVNMTASAPDKLIVSNCDRLSHKYGSAGATAVNTAVNKLKKADAARGIVTVFVDLSDATTMAAYGATAIPTGSAGDPKLNKDAIDKVFSFSGIRPAYLMLLGSTDVIPHVPLENPMAGDGDADVPSDLPYACDKPYSTDVQDFISPTRVVGRVPNVTNDTSPVYLVGLLNAAEAYTNRPAVAYHAFLGIAAQVWTKSSELSLDAVFGTHAGMNVAPPKGYKWTATEAKRLSHFVNCHGAAADPHFYGQKGASFPVAHSAAWMATKVVDATVLAAECCYGAELYDPALPTAAGQMGMCNTYLGRGAYAYFGSTNIAYGPATTNDQADLICQYFLLEIAGGASAGRACLEARLKYVVTKGGVLTPADLKTLGQFTLMADPSLTPVAQSAGPVIASAPGAKNFRAATTAIANHARQRRRAGLAAQATAIPVYRLTEPATPPRMGKTGAFGKLRKIAAELGIKTPDVILSYVVGPARDTFGAKGFAAHAAAAGPAPKAVHTLLERMDPPARLPHLALIRGVQAIEYQDGMDVQAFESR
jgi:hypothetical protein